MSQNRQLTTLTRIVVPASETLVKVQTHFQIQSYNPISFYGTPVERTDFIDFNGQHHWFPTATDWISRLSPKVDLGIQRRGGSYNK